MPLVDSLESPGQDWKIGTSFFPFLVYARYWAHPEVMVSDKYWVRVLGFIFGLGTSGHFPMRS